jgi:hypothetical protein
MADSDLTSNMPADRDGQFFSLQVGGGGGVDPAGVRAQADRPERREMSYCEDDD